MFERATRLDKRHCPTWQAWALMEAQLGRVDEARRLLQKGAWEGVGEKYVARIWQAWALLELRAATGEAEQARAARTSRRYFGHAIEADPYSVPTYIAWAMMEERLGDGRRALDHAYGDVVSAFHYFLQHLNKGAHVLRLRTRAWDLRFPPRARAGP